MEARAGNSRKTNHERTDKENILFSVEIALANSGKTLSFVHLLKFCEGDIAEAERRCDAVLENCTGGNSCEQGNE